MARLDVHPMPGKGDGYVLDVQAELLAHLATRVVVPLLPEDAVPSPISGLNPVFEVKGKASRHGDTGAEHRTTARVEARSRIA